ncbi:MAG: hypothetical protein ABSB58_01370 [Gemmatimonadales bacterium]|jgi:hypothetical protein
MRPLGALLIPGLLIAGAAGARAQGTTGGILLDMPATARSMAMGGASAALLGDAGSVFGNPAGLALIKGTALSVSYERYLVDSWLASAALAVRISKLDIGFGIHILDFGSDSAYVPDPAFGGDRGLATGATIGAYDALGVGTLTYRHGFLSAGVSFKALREHIGTGDAPSDNASAFGADVGIAAAFFDIAALGVVVQNVGSAVHGGTSARAPLPHATRVGFTINFIDPQGTARLLTTTEWVAPAASHHYWIFGFEGGVVSRGVGILGRMGVLAGRGATDLRSPVFGGGLVFHDLRLDYAYQGTNVLGDGLHRMTVGWVW